MLIRLEGKGEFTPSFKFPTTIDDVMWRCCGGVVIVVVVVEVVLWRSCCCCCCFCGHLCKYFIVLDTKGRDVKKLSQ